MAVILVANSGYRWGWWTVEQMVLTLAEQMVVMKAHKKV